MMEVPYNDRAQAEVWPMASQVDSQTEERNDGSAKIPQPEISIIVDGNQIYKPGMKSIFIENSEEVTVSSHNDTQIESGYCSCNAVTFCTCNTVCTCEGVCTCESVCSCVGHCSCNQVCTCDNHCSCDQVCTCNSECTCLSRSDGTGCSCAPVH